MLVFGMRMAMTSVCIVDRIVSGLVRMLASSAVRLMRMVEATTQSHMEGECQRGSETDDGAYHNQSILYCPRQVKLDQRSARNRFRDRAPSG